MISSAPLCAALAALAVLSSARAQDPKIEFDSAVLDFGTVVTGARKTMSLELRNAGAGELRITRFLANCGCLKPQLVVGGRVLVPLEFQRSGQPLVLAAGDSVRLDVELNASGRSGEMSKQVQVFCDDPKREVVTLAVKAICDPGYVLTPPVLDFGAPVICGTTVTRSVLLEPTEIWDGSITGASYRIPGVVVKWRAIEGTAGTRIDVTITDKAQVGHLLWPVELETDSDRIPRILIGLRAEVTPIVQLEGPDPRQPRILDFGLMRGDEPVSLEARIVNHDEKVPYRVQGVTVQSPQKKHLSAEILADEDGVAYALRVTVRPTLKARVVRGAVRLKSDHPTVPSLQIPIRGRVKPK